MADWEALTRQAARRYGIDPNIFVRQIRQESGFNPGARSPAGAIGIAQIMPATARGWGVDPTDPVASLNAAAKHMAEYVKQYGSYRNALVAYNAGPGRVGGALPAETQNYIATILQGGRDPGRTVTPSGSNPAVSPSSSPSAQPSDPGTGADLSGLIAQLTQSQRQQPQASASSLPAPAALAGPAMPAAYRALTTSGAPQRKQQDVSALLSAIQTQGQAPSAAAPTSDAGGATAASAPSAGHPGRGVTISPHATPGVPVVSSRQSEGGLHQTSGLAGYPAHDFFAPAGSHAVAPVGGKIIKLSGHDPRQGAVQGAGGPLGWSVYIRGDDGKTYFLTHLGSRNVKVGQNIRQGQIIGTVADYDKYGRASHIHMGVSG